MGPEVSLWVMSLMESEYSADNRAHSTLIQTVTSKDFHWLSTTLEFVFHFGCDWLEKFLLTTILYIFITGPLVVLASSPVPRCWLTDPSKDINIKWLLMPYAPLRPLWSSNQCRSECRPPNVTPDGSRVVLQQQNELLNHVQSSDSLSLFQKHLKTRLFHKFLYWHDASLHSLNVSNVAFLVIQ